MYGIEGTVAVSTPPPWYLVQDSPQSESHDYLGIIYMPAFLSVYICIFFP